MQPPTTRRNKLRVWIAIGALTAICLGWFFFQLFGPNPQIIVSRATTFITEPLGPDGLPDYAAYYYLRGSEGVTFENNAAVLTWQALWPGELSQEHWLPLCDALGMKEIPSSADALVPLYNSSLRQQIAARLRVQFPAPEDVDDETWEARLRTETAEELIDEAMSRPWTSEQAPELAQWVKQNQKPLDLLIKAAARPRYFSPSPSILSGSDDALIATLLPDISVMPTAVRALKTRAMFHLGEGRSVEAWQDLRACHRLARLMAQDPTLVGQLVAMAIDGIACSGTELLLHHGEIDEQLARQIRDDLVAMPKVTNLLSSLDEFERLSLVDTITRLSKGNMNMSSLTLIAGTGGLQPEDLLTLAQVDWNTVLREGNLWYDELVATFRLPTRAERQTAIDRFERRLQNLGTTVNSPAAWVGNMLSRGGRSEMLKNVVLGLFLPAVSACADAEDRYGTWSELTRVAAALAVYRAVTGEYPEQLADLTPEILPQLPLDLYSGQPFIYQRKADGGYLLYSVFQNGVDDGGTGLGGEIVAGEWLDKPSEEFDYDTSDLVIRVPVPALRLPDPPKDDDDW